jgi:hypothetical protein
MQKTALESVLPSEAVFLCFAWFALHGLIEPLFCPVRVHNND